jgi:type VI secretion system protein ImpH
MATASRRARPTLSETLFAESHRFGFFQAVRLLQLFEPSRPGVGAAGPPRQEPVRFTAEASLAFPASEIREITPAEASGPPTMVVRFMGLTGPQGALPRHYTELVINELRHRNSALAAFLDIFNHRLVSLFYRAWEKYHPHLRVRPDANDDLSVALFSLIGLGTRGHRGRLRVEDRALLYYAGLIAQRPRSAVGLESVLADYFGDIGVSIDQFIGQWLRLDPSSQTSLVPVGGNTRLGVETVLGERVWNTQTKFRVRLGPLSYEQFCSFLPGGDASAELLDLTRVYAGIDFDVDFRLVLRADEVPTTQLGSTGPLATRLGWSTWLTARPRRADADDAVFSSETLALHARPTNARPTTDRPTEEAA